MNQNFDIVHYFTANNLFEEQILKDWCERHHVKYITSPRFPNVVMLHYDDTCVYDKLWTPFSLSCRGLILDLKNKKFLAIPFFKWFNIGEMPETDYEVLKDKKDFEVSEKLDGFLLIRFRDPNTGKYHLTTRGSLDSEHGIYATELMAGNFQDAWLEPYTLMFEGIVKKFQIVIDYTKKPGYDQGLYLIGVRQHWSGKLFTYDEVQNMAETLHISTVKTYEFESLDKLLETAKSLPYSEEGYCIRFQDNILAKVKGTAYLRAHKFISHLSDRNLLEACAEGVDKELIEIAPEEYHEDVVSKINYFKKRATELNNLCYTLYSESPKDSRKEFAIWVFKNVDRYLTGFLFNIWDHKEIDRKQMFDVIGKMENVSGVTKI